jgi:predicted CopG family antitoxin
MCIYAYSIANDKVISLSNKAYQTLKELKRSNESFSDVVLRVAGEGQKRKVAVGVFGQMGRRGYR